MKFYEIQEPYYALICANSRDDALRIYEEQVCERNELTECKRIGLTNAITKMQLATLKEWEIAAFLYGKKECVVLADSSL